MPITALLAASPLTTSQQVMPSHAAAGTAYVIADPDGVATNAVTDFSLPSLVIAESDVDDNQATYTVTLSLAKAPIGVDLSTATISATYNGADLTTNIDDTATTITFTETFTNYDEAIAAPAAGTFTITPSGSSTPSVSFDIIDPAGTLEDTVTLGYVINSINSETYTVQLTFTELPYTLNLGSATTVAESDASTTYTLPACTHFLPTISSTNANGASYNITEAILPAISSYTAATTTSGITAVVGVRTLSYSSVAVTVQDCTADGANFAGGTGADADNAWEIDNDLRLDLMSRLVNGDSVGDIYRDKHYTLTADMDMNNANALWGNGVTGSTLDEY